MAKKQISFCPYYLDNVKCPEGMSRIDITDPSTKGLSIRVTRREKAWSFKWTVPGTDKQGRIDLGLYPAVTIVEARNKALEARQHIRDGKDPRDVIAEAAAKAADEKPFLVSDLCALRLAIKVAGIANPKGGWKVKPLRTAKHIKRRYELIGEAIGTIPVRDFAIDPHYNTVINPYRLKGQLRQAGVFHTDLTTLMTFAVSEGKRAYNPLIGKESPDPKNVRKRNLTPDEIIRFWNELPYAIVGSASVRRILMLCLILGQRLSEIAGITRDELQLKHPEGARVVFDASRVKNGEKYGNHVVPLPDIAVDIILDALRVNSNTSQWLFPNDAMTGDLNAQVIGSTLRRAIEAGDFSIEKFTAHDLRRTVGTQMLNKKNGLKIPKFDKYLVLNHRSATKGNVSDEVYDQNEYFDEKREALDKWAAFLNRIVNGVAVEREAA